MNAAITFSDRRSPNSGHLWIQQGRRWCVLFAAALLSVSVGLANGAASESSSGESPEIEFKVLLIIKKRTDAWSPLFLPVRAEMSEAEIASARRCFEIETPDMVKDITRGKVRFVPTVHVSEKPLRFWNPERRDSAEIHKEEMFEEFSRIARPGEYDSVGYYFLPRDRKSGYSIPRAGYGVGWFERSHAAGAFAVHAAEMNPRDEIFLHEWMHGLEQFYHGKPGVRLPNGWLHGNRSYRAYRARYYRPGDTFRGWMDWYKDFLNREIRESDGFSGLGSAAWTHGPMRDAQPRKFPRPSRGKTPSRSYPGWVYRLMEGDLSSAKLGPDLLQDAPGATADLSPWTLKQWSKGKGNLAERMLVDGKAVLRVRNRTADDSKLIRKVALEPFRNYVLTAEVRSEGVEIVEPGGQFGVTVQAGSGTVPRTFVGSVDWTPVTLCFTTGNRAAETELRLGVGGFASLARGTAEFRNVRIRQVLYPEVR